MSGVLSALGYPAVTYVTSAACSSRRQQPRPQSNGRSSPIGAAIASVCSESGNPHGGGGVKTNPVLGLAPRKRLPDPFHFAKLRCMAGMWGKMSGWVTGRLGGEKGGSSPGL